MLLRNIVLPLCFSSFFLHAQERLDSLSFEEILLSRGMSTNVVIEEEEVKEFASDFEMTMEDGSKKKLSDFKGQVIYLSFWASWCGPCIKGFNNYRALRDKMDSLGVLLLNVSIDEDPKEWKAGIAKHQPNGVHGLVSHDDIRELYQVYNVPRYEIVGKKGQFLYLSDEPGRDVLENFRQFMEEKGP